ncbi:MAG: DUF2306 domain-containing protein [Pseudolysinimonas sp.]
MTNQLTATPASTRAPRRGRPEWLIPVGLLLLSLVPVFAGASRISELAFGAEITEANARFFHSPIPVIAHVIGATTYLVLGAFQFLPRLRRGRPSWHKIAGRILVPAGLIAGLSGMWMGVFYERPVFDMVVRLTFGALMVICLLLGLRAVLRRDFSTHRAWMIRGYAVGIGAGTQVFTTLPFVIAFGGAQLDPTATALLLVAGWVINLSVAEVAIRRAGATRRSVA